MAIARHNPIPAPETYVLAENEFERYENELLLYPERYGDDEDTREPGPVLDAYSERLEIALNLKCDEMFRDWVDAVGAAHDLTRSEAIRRLVRLGITKLSGEIVALPRQLSLIPKSEAA